MEKPEMTPLTEAELENLEKLAEHFKPAEDHEICRGCGAEIDPNVCGCGDGPHGYDDNSGHPFVPMGCNCLRAKDFDEIPRKDRAMYAALAVAVPRLIAGVREQRALGRAEALEVLEVLLDFNQPGIDHSEDCLERHLRDTDCPRCAVIRKGYATLREREALKERQSQQMNPWTPNRIGPRFRCWLFHRRHWFSNDFGTWWTSGRVIYEIKCMKCEDCWSDIHPWKKDS